MENLRIIIILILIIIVYGCKDNYVTSDVNSEAKKVIQIKHPSGKLNPQYEKMSKYIDTCFFIRLSKKKENYIGKIQKLLISDDTLFISDKITNSVFIYDIKGNLVKKINNVGRGPHEYSSISDFTIDWSKKNIILSDTRQKKYLKYSFKGDFISSERMESYGGRISYLCKNRFALYNNFNAISEDDMHNVFITDFNGEKVKRYFKYPSSMMSKFLMGKNDYFWNSNTKNISLIRFYDNNVYTFAKDSIYPKYFLDFSEYNLPKGEKLSLKKIGNYTHTLSDFFETKNFVSFSYVFNKSNILLFYDKQSSKFVFPRNVDWEFEPFLHYSFFPNYVIGCYDNFFITSVPSSYITSFVKNFPKDLYTEADREEFNKIPDLKFLENVTDMDNPILVFYKLKSII